MKRRDFIKNVAPVAVVPFFSNKLFAAAYTPSVLNEAALLTIGPESDRVLVIVQMTGGNDGLNTVFPMDQYSNLMAARTNMLMPDTAPLVLGSTQTAIHPAMTGLKSMYDEHKLAVVQSVGYANPNFSHFRATDIWTSGADSAEVLTTGWGGRYLEYAFPGFPDAYPSTAMPDPLAIQIGSNLSPALQGYEISTGQTVPTSFNGSITSLLSYTNTTAPGGNAGTELTFLRNQQAYTNQYANRIIAAWNGGTNLATYATTSTSSIAQQLKIVARLIKGGLKTKIFWVSLGSFDTHSNQVTTSNKTLGTHATMLGDMSNAIRAFQTDLSLMALEDRVVGFTFSEFGRRIKSNGSVGTDHGTAAPMFVFGSKVNWGVIGSNPVIPAVATTNDQVAMQYDFHKVYASILQNWFCVPQADAQTVLGDTAVALNAINGGCWTVIPIELTKFSVEKANTADAHIEWATANESNTAKYDIERSTDGKRFVKVGEVKAVGHSHEPTRYDFLDKNLPLSVTNTFYYRLKISDLDDTSTLTETRSISFDKIGKNLVVDIFPNPSHNSKCHLILRGGLQEDILTEISINDIYGRQLLQISEYLRLDSTFDFDLGISATSGVYFVTIKNGVSHIVQKLIIQ
jgi:uncharacterized protein (DUF1501 family)